MATAQCAHCGTIMNTDEAGLRRTHGLAEFEVIRFVCPDCGTKGFRATETFESCRYKGNSDNYQWGALAEDKQYDTPPWLINGYGVFVDDGEPIKEFDDKNDAEAYAKRIAEAAKIDTRVETI